MAVTCVEHTRRLTRLQHMMYYSHAFYNRAAHEDGACAVHEIYVAHMLYTKVNSHVTCEFGLSHSIKIEGHTYVPARKCQLRRQLYHIYVAT